MRGGLPDQGSDAEAVKSRLVQARSRQTARTDPNVCEYWILN